jgi:hypothetical protein
LKSHDANQRRHFIGGSDARIIMGKYEAALVRLWWEKRGEAEPKDLSDNLIFQLGFVTENLMGPSRQGRGVLQHAGADCAGNRSQQTKRAKRCTANVEDEN